MTSVMTESDMEIPVWIGEQQKWVTGLGIKTTCHDIIYALLSHTKSGGDDVGNYAMFESWRGVERQLAGRTKLCKIWKAWGDDAENVTLTLRSIDLDTSCEVSHCKPRVHHKSKRSRASLVDQVNQAPVYPKQLSRQSLSSQHVLKDRQNTMGCMPHRQMFKTDKRSSRSDFRSSRSALPDRACSQMNLLAKEHKPLGLKERKPNVQLACHIGANNPMKSSKSCLRHPSEVSTYEDVYQKRSRSKRAETERTRRDYASLPRDLRQSQRKAKQEKQQILQSKNFHKVLQIILKQEKKIREQLDKLKSMDIQLETQERKSRENEIEMEYTLPEYDEKNQKNSLFPALKSNDIEAYSHMCDTILDMQNKLDQEECRISDLSTVIREETFSAEPALCVETLTESKIMGPRLTDTKALSENEMIQQEIEALRRELQQANEVGHKQQKEIDSVAQSIKDYDQQLDAKAKMIDDLLCELGEGDNEAITETVNEHQVLVSSAAETKSMGGERSDKGVFEEDACERQGYRAKTMREQGDGKEDELKMKHQDDSDSEPNYLKDISTIGRSVNTEDMYTLTIVSDFNSTWDEDSFLISHNNLSKVPKEDAAEKRLSSEDLKKSPSGESSASSGFCDIDLLTIDQDLSSETNNLNNHNNEKTYAKTFPFPSYNAMKKLTFRCRKPSDGSESGLSSICGEEGFARAVETLV